MAALPCESLSKSDVAAAEAPVAAGAALAAEGTAASTSLRSSPHQGESAELSGPPRQHGEASMGAKSTQGKPAELTGANGPPSHVGEASLASQSMQGEPAESHGPPRQHGEASLADQSTQGKPAESNGLPSEASMATTPVRVHEGAAQDPHPHVDTRHAESPPSPAAVAGCTTPRGACGEQRDGAAIPPAPCAAVPPAPACVSQPSHAPEPSAGGSDGSCDDCIERSGHWKGG